MALGEEDLICMRPIQRRSAVERVQLVRDSDQRVAQVARQLESSNSWVCPGGCPRPRSMWVMRLA